VILHKNADNKLRGRIKEVVNNISGNPRLHVHIKKLEGGLKQMYRYRLGDLTILYEIHENIKTIEGRGSVYK
jgi:mRNA-degrading endonuclease RelE of RelBE toxin-antitoxin system